MSKAKSSGPFRGNGCLIIVVLFLIGLGIAAWKILSALSPIATSIGDLSRAAKQVAPQVEGVRDPHALNARLAEIGLKKLPDGYAALLGLFITSDISPDRIYDAVVIAPSGTDPADLLEQNSKESFKFRAPTSTSLLFARRNENLPGTVKLMDTQRTALTSALQKTGQKSIPFGQNELEVDIFTRPGAQQTAILAQAASNLLVAGIGPDESQVIEVLSKFLEPLPAPGKIYDVETNYGTRAVAKVLGAAAKAFEFEEAFMAISIAPDGTSGQAKPKKPQVLKLRAEEFAMWKPVLKGVTPLTLDETQALGPTMIGGQPKYDLNTLDNNSMYVENQLPRWLSGRVPIEALPQKRTGFSWEKVIRPLRRSLGESSDAQTYKTKDGKSIKLFLSSDLNISRDKALELFAQYDYDLEKMDKELLLSIAAELRKQASSFTVKEIQSSLNHNEYQTLTFRLTSIVEDLLKKKGIERVRTRVRDTKP